MTDVLIGLIRDYTWEHISTFVNSVERSGYRGQKVMFVCNVKGDVIARLYDLGWIMIPFTPDPSQDFGTSRHIPVLAFLKENSFRYVIYCDARDLVVQTDPIPWLEANLHEGLIGASECVRIGDQSTNLGWIQKTVGPGIADALRQEDVLCAGTIVGSCKPVIDLLNDICILSQKTSGWGYDQAYINYLLRVTPFKEMTKVPRMREGFIATCSWFLSWPRIWDSLRTDESPDFDLSTATVYRPGTKEPFCILHQYDRDGEWDKAIRRKYE